MNDDQKKLYEEMFRMPEKSYMGSKVYAVEELKHYKGLIENTEGLSRRDKMRLKLKGKLKEREIENEFKPLKRKW